MTEATPAVRDVVVLADDLIWASRLADAITAAGANPRRVRRLADLTPILGTNEGAGARPNASAGWAVIDLTARAYDGIEAIRAAVSSGARVVAVGQHDDIPLRKAAIAAGAERVYTYRALFENGAKVLATWLDG